MSSQTAAIAVEARSASFSLPFPAPEEGTIGWLGDATPGNGESTFSGWTEDGRWLRHSRAPPFSLPSTLRFVHKERHETCCFQVQGINPRMASTTQPAARVVIIYNADGTLRGKVAYAYRKLFPRDDGTTAQPACGNCDITHGGLSLSETPAWRTRKAALEQELGVKIEQRHRDELDSKVSGARDFDDVFHCERVAHSD